MKMVLMLGLALVACIQIVQSQDPTPQKIDLDCLAKVGLDRKVIETVAATAILPRDNYQLKEYLSCNYKKQGYQGENGEILMPNVTRWLENYYNATDLEVIEPCKNTNTTSHPEAAFNALECVMNKLINLKPK